MADTTVMCAPPYEGNSLYSYYPYGYGRGDVESLMNHNLHSTITEGSREVISELNTDTNFIRSAIDAHGLRLGDAIQGVSRDIKDVMTNMCQEGRQTERAISDVRYEVAQEGRANERAFGEVQRTIHHESRMTEKGLCDTRDTVRQEGRQTEKGLCDVGNIVRQEGRLTEQALNAGFSRTNDNLFKEAQELKLGQGRIERQIADGLAQVKLDALQNKFELSKQLAECCCEQKSLAHELNAKVLTTISESEMGRLRDENQNLRLAALIQGNGHGRGNG